MPGIEIKGRSKRANYRHGGRPGIPHGPVDKFKPEFKPKTGLTRDKIEGSLKDLKDRKLKERLSKTGLTRNKIEGSLKDLKNRKRKSIELKPIPNSLNKFKRTAKKKKTMERNY